MDINLLHFSTSDISRSSISSNPVDSKRMMRAVSPNTMRSRMMRSMMRSPSQNHLRNQLTFQLTRLDSSNMLSRGLLGLLCWSKSSGKIVQIQRRNPILYYLLSICAKTTKLIQTIQTIQHLTLQSSQNQDLTSLETKISYSSSPVHFSQPQPAA
jgi:hypothetical protein